MRRNFLRAMLLIASTAFIVGFLGGTIGFLITKSFVNDSRNDSEVVTRDNFIIEKFEEQSRTIDSVTKASPAVVNIIVTKDLTYYYNQRRNPSIDQYLYGYLGNLNQGPVQERTVTKKVGGGTGFIISEDGMILTNKHVVGDPDAEYTVITQEGKEFRAEILGKDPINDFAIVKINSDEKLSVIELGDSDDLKIGQTVIAIGNSLAEFNHTVTKGIVSGINRRILTGDSYNNSALIEEAIQTDAAINPGNSGGPLLDLNGRVIGINTAVSRSGQLIGFAIPINLAKSVIEGVRKYGRFVRPFLGVRYILVTETFADENNLDIDFGAYLMKSEDESMPAVVPNSPADVAGLQEGDIITQVDGIDVTLDDSLVELLSKKFPGDQVKLRILRSRNEIELSVTLEEFKN